MQNSFEKGILQGMVSIYTLNVFFLFQPYFFIVAIYVYLCKHPCHKQPQKGTLVT